MLSIGRLGAGAEDYYINCVADGAEEYYLGSGEAPGYWTGQGAARLGLVGEVDADALRSILAARSPVDGTDLGIGNAPSGRVAGFDFSFSAPKSSSLLYGLGHSEVSDAVRAAHDEAVAGGLAYLEAHGVFTRRGAGGATRIGTEGVIAAAFRHRTSRSGDPQLHTHVLVANALHGADGRWSTLDSNAAYHHGRAAGFVYQAVLRNELACRLGLSFGPVVNGSAEIDGVDPDMVRAFSTRRVAIQGRLGEWGVDSAKAAQVATLATRPTKAMPAPDAGIDRPGSLRATWADRARQLGHDPDRLNELAGEPRYLDLSDGLVYEVAEHLIGPGGLTARESAFERRDVVRHVAAMCPDGASLYVIEHITECVMESPEVVDLGTVGRGGEARCTTLDLLDIERSLARSAESLRSSKRGIVAPDVVAATIAQRPTMAPEQIAMVEKLTSSGDGVQVVIGKAGAGKTFALDAARAAWQESGHRVFGAALSARAAGELADGAHMNAMTLASLERAVVAGTIQYRENDVLMIDEAGMVGTRVFANAVEAATSQGAKVVLVGDDRQLPNPHRFESTCGSSRLRYHEFAFKRMSSTVSPR